MDQFYSLLFLQASMTSAIRIPLSQAASRTLLYEVFLCPLAMERRLDSKILVLCLRGETFDLGTRHRSRRRHGLGFV